MTFSSDYTSLLQEAAVSPLQFNARTGQHIHTIPGGSMITADLSEGYLPIPGNRLYRPYVSAAEAAWILSGEESISWISKHCKIWNKFAQDGYIWGSYGHRTYPQIKKVLHQLRFDSSTRRAVINLWDSRTDTSDSKNAPCPTQIVINTCGEFVDMQILMRSSDLFVGLPYDIMTWGLILDAIAEELWRKPRYLTFFLAHAHLYKSHREYVPIEPEALYEYKLPLPKLSISQILEFRDEYVLQAKQQLKTQGPSKDYDPKPVVFE